MAKLELIQKNMLYVLLTLLALVTLILGGLYFGTDLFYIPKNFIVELKEKPQNQYKATIKILYSDVDNAGTYVVVGENKTGNTGVIVQGFYAEEIEQGENLEVILYPKVYIFIKDNADMNRRVFSFQGKLKKDNRRYKKVIFKLE
jgi:hypothetical protein